MPLSNAKKETVEHFEIDEDGSYIYWPDLDLHLGWEQLQQIVDPVAAQKAKQKSHEFNVRYGAFFCARCVLCGYSLGAMRRCSSILRLGSTARSLRTSAGQ
jgi:hypothetical protein